MQQVQAAYLRCPANASPSSGPTTSQLASRGIASGAAVALPTGGAGAGAGADESASVWGGAEEGIDPARAQQVFFLTFLCLEVSGLRWGWYLGARGGRGRLRVEGGDCQNY